MEKEQKKDSQTTLTYKLGEFITRKLTTFYAKQSKVSNNPFLFVDEMPQLSFLEDKTLLKPVIEEIKSKMKHKDAMPSFDEISPDQVDISRNRQWLTVFLYGFSEKVEKNCNLYPETTKILEKVPHLITAWISILEPGYHIPPHRGLTKGLLVCHIPIILPKDKKKCRIRVADEIEHWSEDRMFLIDDTYEHEVWNETPDERVVLILHVDRPMRFWGHCVYKLFLRLVKMSSYYKVPKKNLDDSSDRMEAMAKNMRDMMENN